MNVGYWTRQNEEWFVHRRSRIRLAMREGDPHKLELKTAQEWRKSLRYEAKVQQDVLSQFETLSASVIL